MDPEQFTEPDPGSVKSGFSRKATAWHARQVAKSVPGHPLTLLVGSEEVLVERAIAAAVSQARSRDPQLEVRRLDAAEPGAAGAVLQACSPTLFGSSSLVILDKFESADEDVVATVVELGALGVSAGAAAPADTPSMVVIHAGGAKGKKTLDAVAAGPHNRVDCQEIKRGRATAEFVVTEFRSNKKVIAADAVALLVSVFDSDLRLLANASRQLAADIEARAITVDHVRTYFGSIAEVTGFQIADAVLAHRPGEAMRLVRTSEVSAGGNIGPATVAAIANGFRQVVKFTATSPGMSERDRAVAVGVPPWRLRAIAEQARQWRPQDIASAILSLVDTDAAMKGGLRVGEQLDPSQKAFVLEQLIERLARRTADTR